MSARLKLLDRESDKVLYGWQYKAGEHPPPPPVKVITGQHGVIARADTVHGPHSRVMDGDWLVETDAGLDIYTDAYVRDFFRLPGDDPTAVVKPVQLG